MLQSLPYTWEKGVAYGGADTVSAGFITARWLLDLDRPILLVAPDSEQALRLAQAIRVWHGPAVYLFPDIPLMPWDLADLPSSAQGGIIRGWNLIDRGAVRVGVMTPACSLYPSPPRRSLHLEAGETAAMEAVIRKLVFRGYRRVPLCEAWGDIAVRGAIVDIFPPTEDDPLRLEWEGDELLSIRTFNVENQRSRVQRKEVAIPGFSLVDSEGRSRLLSLLRERTTGLGGDRLLLQARESGRLGPLALFYPLARYAREPSRGSGRGESPDACRIVYDRRGVEEAFEEMGEACRVQAKMSAEEGFFDIAPEMLFPSLYTCGAWDGAFELFRTEESTRKIAREGVGIVRGQADTFSSEIRRLKGEGYRVVILVGSPSHRSTLQRYLDETGTGDVEWMEGEADDAWVNPDIRIAWIPDRLILGKVRRSRGKGPLRYGYSLQLDQIKEQDPIVHIEHGVGRFMGLALMENEEFVHLHYEDGELYVPMDQLDLLTTWVGGEDAEPPLERLGGKRWETHRKKARREAAKIVDALAKLYARRRMSEGITFKPDDDFQRQFEAQFPFEETEDQSRALEEIKRDMESQGVMDRLLCGDVGFGKTEVAMRAAFKAVSSGYQVVLLAPTTVLAYQHFRTFSERFAPFPVRVAWVSRFLTSSQQRKVLEDAALGGVDILIGTHRLLSDDVAFHRLGLLVIDEEQRFGVKQKEKFRELRSSVDVLSMSATPIPRTMHMALMGIRDLSILATPPLGRRAVETSVATFNPSFIQQAIRHEIERGGQVFFIHNRVQEIMRVQRYLRELLPEIPIVTTHGKMSEAILEKNLLAFIQGEAPILLTTAIVENGMDIPRANTMIINNAHTFGLSQLYQLRGRVGRSLDQGYCYLLVPSLSHLGDKPRRRLQALEEFSQLGSGFKIAARDLDIRGAGNLLGVEQHGHVEAVGYELFCRMVEEKAREIRGEEIVEEIPINLALPISVAIPSSYVHDQNERLALYRRLMKGEIEAVREECRDRFGPIVPEMDDLFALFKVRRLGQELRLTQIAHTDARLTLQFHPSTPVDPAHLVQMAQRYPGSMLTPEGVFTLPVDGRGRDLLKAIQSLLLTMKGVL